MAGRTWAVACAVMMMVAAALPGGAQIPQDDAGSGQDAPETAAPEVWIQPGPIYNGTSFPAVGDVMDHYAFHANAGETIHVRLWGVKPCFRILGPDNGWNGVNCGITPTGFLTDTVVADHSGTWFLAVAPSQSDAYRFSLGIDETPDEPHPTSVSLPGPVPADLVPGDDPTCGGVPDAETTATHGAGDPALPDLVWAATKTGFRAIVAWSSETASIGAIEVNLAGGDTMTFEEAVPHLDHVFFLDGLPIGEVLCFRAEQGDDTSTVVADWHGLTLRNGPTAYDAATGTYMINTVSLANEVPGEARILAETEEYGERLFDATDGHVQSGRNIVLFYDAQRHHSGYYSCNAVGKMVTPRDTPGCNRMADIIYTSDACVGNAACTFMDAIASPDRAIWMHWYFQATPGVSLDDTGLLLLHEMGHYAFGAQDLYLSGSCWDASLKISVMGSSRSATEFDDEANRCPNEAQLSGYVPTWTLMRERFPEIPDRSSIVFGPAGGGSENHVHAFGAAASTLQTVDPVGLVEMFDDDSGSGADARYTRDAAVSAAPGVVYQGIHTSFFLDSWDWY